MKNSFHSESAKTYRFINKNCNCFSPFVSLVPTDETKRESWNRFSAIIATTDFYRLNWCISGQLLIHDSPLPGNCNDGQHFLLNTTSFISVIDQRSMLQQIHNTLVILKLFIVASLNNSLRLQRSWYCDTTKRYSCMVTRKTTIHMRMFAILYNIKYNREHYLMINSSLLLSITCFWVRQAHFTNVSRIERPYWINEEGLNVLSDADRTTLFLQTHTKLLYEFQHQAFLTYTLSIMNSQLF